MYCAHTHFVIFIVGNHIPVVLLIFSAGPVNITWAEENVMVAAIFQCFYPAQATGEALFNIMTYNNMNPAGRLPFTWYRDSSQVVISKVVFSFLLFF